MPSRLSERYKFSVLKLSIQMLLLLIIQVKPAVVSSNISKDVETNTGLWQTDLGQEKPQWPQGQWARSCHWQMSEVRLTSPRTPDKQARGLKSQTTFSKGLGFYGLTSEVTREVTTGPVTPVTASSLYEPWFYLRHSVSTLRLLKSKGCDTRCLSIFLRLQHGLGGQSGRSGKGQGDASSELYLFWF